MPLPERSLILLLLLPFPLPSPLLLLPWHEDLALLVKVRGFDYITATTSVDVIAGEFKTALTMLCDGHI